MEKITNFQKIKKHKKEHLTIVLGLSITGLGVIRSLGREGIKVFGFDYNAKGCDGFYSKYVKANICPHPVYQPEKLAEFLTERFKNESKKPILFPTSDEFVKFISDFRDTLEQCFLFNISSKEIVNSIMDKKIQYELAKKAGIITPKTYSPASIEEVHAVGKELEYPLVIKARNSFRWREELGGVFKGSRVNNKDELIEKCEKFFKSNIPIIIQKLISGPDTNHFKFCAYVDKEGRFLAKFTLRKIRQYPVNFGIGSCVESIGYGQLEDAGVRFFKGIDYRGVGSAEFKLDPEDNRLKLIELNPRYWLQNEQATFCGMNFAIAQYLDLSGQEMPLINKFKTGVKWVDPVLDFKSFIEQGHHNKLFLFGWLRFILKCNIFSVFSWHDLRPFLKSIGYSLWKEKII